MILLVGGVIVCCMGFFWVGIPMILLSLFMKE
jgi:hypothetical protein